MKFYDISHGLFSTGVYPGDPVPWSGRIRRIDIGDDYNLSAFFTGSHSGTRLDTPRHFLESRDTIDRIPPGFLIGPRTVVTVEGVVIDAQIEELLPRCQERILFHGNGQVFLDRSAAFVLTDSDALLVRMDTISIGSEAEKRLVHLELSGAGIPILEGTVLDDVPGGGYLLIALPLELRGLEASPCCAVLLQGTLPRDERFSQYGRSAIIQSGTTA